MRWRAATTAIALVLAGFAAQKGAAPNAAAQEDEEVRINTHAYSPPQVLLQSQSQLVQIAVVVRDARGQAVSGLTQNDFEVVEDGATRGIVGFSAIPAAPLPGLSAATASAAPAGHPAPWQEAPSHSVLFFFDDLHGTAQELAGAQNAARRLAGLVLGPHVRGAIYTASGGMLLDYTPDAAAAVSAIGRVSLHLPPASGLGSCPPLAPFQALMIAHEDVTALLAAVSAMRTCTTADDDAVRTEALRVWYESRARSLRMLDSIDKAIGVESLQPGTRLLLLLSSGFLSSSLESSRAAAIDHAIRERIVINAVDAKGAWSDQPIRLLRRPGAGMLPESTFTVDPGVDAANANALQEALDSAPREISVGTGGTFFRGAEDLAGGFIQLGALPETRYVIAFHAAPGNAAVYRKLEVHLTPSHSGHVQARPGYFMGAIASALAPSQGEVRKLDLEAVQEETISDIPLELTVRPGKTDSGEPSLSLQIHVDIGKLQFTDRGGRHTQRLAFIGAVLDQRGGLVSAREGAIDLALKDETLARWKASGVNATLTLRVPPGKYRARVVAEDTGGKMGAANQTVNVEN